MAKDDAPEEPKEEVKEEVEVKEEAVVEAPATDDTSDDDVTDQPEEPTEETPEEPEPVVAEEAVEETKEEAKAEPEQPSRRESLRIQQIIEKAKQGAYAPKEETPAGLNYGEELDAAPEVIEKLEADRKAAVDIGVNNVLSQTRTDNWKMSLKIDTPIVNAKYPQLDSKSPEFDAATTDAINARYLHLVGYDPRADVVANPNIDYADYVEAEMELIERVAGRKAQESSKNIAKQSANTGLRPDGSAAKPLNIDPNRDPSEMSTEELNAMISRTMPRDSRGRFTK